MRHYDRKFQTASLKLQRRAGERFVFVPWLSQTKSDDPGPRLFPEYSGQSQREDGPYAVLLPKLPGTRWVLPSGQSSPGSLEVLHRSHRVLLTLLTHSLCFESSLLPPDEHLEKRQRSALHRYPPLA